VDAGEDLISAALRETEEETGINARAIELDRSFEYQIAYDVDHKKYGLYHKQVFYYLGYVDQACEVRPTEHFNYRWWDWPPGPIQQETIDPLLAAVQEHLGT